MKINVILFKGIIYQIINIQNWKSYIGLTTKEEYMEYIESHFEIALKNKKRYKTKYFYNAIRKYGKENFKIIILGEIFAESKLELEQKLDIAEIDCIYHFRTFGADGMHFDRVYGYNMTIGGNRGPGLPKGFKFSNEVNKQKSKIMIGRKLSNTHKENISKSGIKNYKDNPERAKKQSKTISGENNYKYKKIDQEKLTILYHLNFTCQQIGIILNVSSMVPKKRLKQLKLIRNSRKNLWEDSAQRKNLVNLYKKGDITYEQLIKQREHYINSKKLS